VSASLSAEAAIVAKAAHSVTVFKPGIRMNKHIPYLVFPFFLRTEIRSLPPLMRGVLRDLHELPMEEVAEQLGISIVAVKSRLMRARLVLRRRLERQLDIVPA